MTDVSVDDRRTVYAVHWNVDLDEARQQLSRWGFHEIDGLKKDAVLNGNEARERARSNAIDRDAMYFWVGNYDWGVGDDSAIYSFVYSVYTGPDGRLWDGAKQGATAA